MTAPTPSNFLSLILAHPILPRVLRSLASLHPPLPNYFLAGGCLRNPVWSAVVPGCQLPINDFDVAFYDAEGDKNQELAAKHALSKVHPGLKFDVKNQHSFGRWRPVKGNRQFENGLYASVEDGIAHWLHTATAVGLRIENEPGAQSDVRTILLERDGTLFRIFAPYGLDDLFFGVVRPVPAHKESEAALMKGHLYLAACRGLVAQEVK